MSEQPQPSPLVLSALADLLRKRPGLVKEGRPSMDTIITELGSTLRDYEVVSVTIPFLNRFCERLARLFPQHAQPYDQPDPEEARCFIAVQDQDGNWWPGDDADLEMRLEDLLVGWFDFYQRINPDDSTSLEHLTDQTVLQIWRVVHPPQQLSLNI